MIIVVRTKEDAEAVSGMSRHITIGAKLEVVNMTGYAFPIFHKGRVIKHIKPQTNALIEYA